MAYKLLVINPGSTSTKIAYYEDQEQKQVLSLSHSAEELAPFEEVLDQKEFRTKVIEEAVAGWGVSLDELSAVVGRGNVLPNMKGGGYKVEENMVKALEAGLAVPHASNLAALIAYGIANPRNIPAYIYDAVTADEYEDIARVTGFAEVSRESKLHVLNQKASARKAAEKLGKKYDEVNIIVLHMGGGCTVGLHSNGRIIDGVSDDESHFSPERAGGIPTPRVADLCFSGEYDAKSFLKKVRGQGGLISHLGTADLREVEKRIAEGDEKAEFIYNAQAYVLAKSVGLLAPVADGKIDFIVLTGGIAFSEKMTALIRERIEFIAPVVIEPGENEMEALAFGAIRMLDGESYHIYGTDQ
ncbi:MAG: butyrate kinase [Clostridiales Family XIII bacterium]|nr:butyrate kinase [Clostridiales Family XIII bacterium]